MLRLLFARRDAEQDVDLDHDERALQSRNLVNCRSDGAEEDIVGVVTRLVQYDDELWSRRCLCRHPRRLSGCRVVVLAVARRPREAQLANSRDPRAWGHRAQSEDDVPC
jgi:hypothetical protein